MFLNKPKKLPDIWATFEIKMRTKSFKKLPNLVPLVVIITIIYRMFFITQTNAKFSDFNERDNRQTQRHRHQAFLRRDV